VVEPINECDALVEIFLSFHAVGMNRMVLTTDSRQVQVDGFSGGGSMLRANEFVKRKKEQADANQRWHGFLRGRLQLNLPTEKCRGKFFRAVASWS
jgi:hypothetical protein